MSCGYWTELGGTSQTFPVVQHTLELGTGMHDQESDGSGTDNYTREVVFNVFFCEGALFTRRRLARVYSGGL